MTATRKPRRTTRKLQGATAATDEARTTAKTSKLDLIVGQLTRPEGRQPRRARRRHRLAGALGPRRAGGLTEEEGPRHHL